MSLNYDAMLNIGSLYVRLRCDRLSHLILRVIRTYLKT